MKTHAWSPSHEVPARSRSAACTFRHDRSASTTAGESGKVRRLRCDFGAVRSTRPPTRRTVPVTRSRGRGRGRSSAARGPRRSSVRCWRAGAREVRAGGRGGRRGRCGARQGRGSRPPAGRPSAWRRSRRRSGHDAVPDRGVEHHPQHGEGGPAGRAADRLAGLPVPAVPVPDHAGQHPLDIAGREPRQPDATELGEDVLPHDDAVELDGRRLPVRGQRRATSPPPLPVRLDGRGPLTGGLVALGDLLDLPGASVAPRPGSVPCGWSAATCRSGRPT